MAPVPLAASTAQATQFINPSPITINDAPTDGVVTPATPSPSTISVSGQSGVVKSVEVDLSGFQHNSQKDVDVLLRGPGGQVVTLLSDVGWEPRRLKRRPRTAGGRGAIPDAGGHVRDHEAHKRVLRAHGQRQRIS